MAAVHHGTNDQSRKTAEQISGCYYQSVDSQEPDHPYQVNENIVDNACDTVGKDTSTLSGQESPHQKQHYVPYYLSIVFFYLSNMLLGS
jgi:hypothetical protein